MEGGESFLHLLDRDGGRVDAGGRSEYAGDRE